MLLQIRFYFPTNDIKVINYVPASSLPIRGLFFFFFLVFLFCFFSYCFFSYCFVCLFVCFFFAPIAGLVAFFKMANTHWLSKSHLLKVWDILSLVINTSFLHTCLMYWLSFKTDHDRLLTTLAKSIVSKETLCDIWLTINLRGKKIAALIFTARQREWKILFSRPATLIESKSQRVVFFISK